MRNLLLIFSTVFILFSCKQQAQKSLELIDNIALAKSTLKVEVLAQDLDVPWDLAYADDGFLWVAEQGGAVSRIELSTGKRKQVLKIDEVWRQRTSGLLGMAVHPNFKLNPYVFVNYTAKRDSLIVSRLVRYTFKNDSLYNAKLLLEIDGNTAHNGSRIAFSSNGKLLWATGDAHHFENAQNDESLNGKILRLNTDGSIPQDNPNPKSYVWAKGFRNIQGLAVSNKGLVYTSEHGDAIEDEVNLIDKAANYGWPLIEGKHDLAKEKAFAAANNTTEPIRSWTPVIAPSGLTYYNSNAIPEWQNSLLLTTLKARSLRVLKLNDDGKSIADEEIFFADYYGRLRDVCVDADGAVYISTSNKDWNPSPGFPLAGDDKILKISFTQKAAKKALKGVKAENALPKNGQQLYQVYCGSCHKEDGKGVSGVFPSLVGSAKVNGTQNSLIQILLKGINQNSSQQMPAFNFLKDDEAAQILTYIRKSWGNKGEEINANQIKLNR